MFLTQGKMDIIRKKRNKLAALRIAIPLRNWPECMLQIKAATLSLGSQCTSQFLMCDYVHSFMGIFYCSASTLLRDDR